MPDDGLLQLTDDDKFLKRKKNMENLLERAKQENGGQFVPLGDIEQILSEGALKALIRGFEPHNSEDTYKTAVQRILNRRIEDDLASYQFLRVFATLIYCGNERYVKAAIQYFLHMEESDTFGTPDYDTWTPPQDDSLRPNRPSDEDVINFYNDMGKQEDGFYKAFFDQKRYFCALILKEGGRHEEPKEMVLPFAVETEEVLGKGSAGSVFRVKIAKHHWVDKWLSNPEDMLLAIKRFDAPKTGKGTDRYDNEFGSLMKLNVASIKSENVMLPLASLIHGEQRYLIYDLADSDLEDYMSNQDPAYAFNADRTMTVLKNGTDLVGALSWIHRYRPYHSIWHGDIKPRNILVFKNRSKEIWKLADFDRSHAKPTHSESVSGTTITRGDTYRPPPDYKGGKLGDIWAMACMISLILTWLSDGPKGIGEFIEKRNKGDADNPDFFFEQDNLQTFSILNSGVKEWLDLLRNRAEVLADNQNSEQAEAGDLFWYSTYVKNVTEHLEECVFVPYSTQNTSAKDFYNFMEQEYSRIPHTEDAKPEGAEKLRIPPTEPFDPNSSGVSSGSEAETSGKSLSQRSHHRKHHSTSPEAIDNLSNMTLTDNHEGGQSTVHTNCTRLCSAIGKMNPPSKLLEQASDLNKVCPKCGDAPIHKAIRRKEKEWFLLLLGTGGIDIELENKVGGTATPLMRSYIECHMWAAEALVKAGCNREIDYKAVDPSAGRDKIKKYIKKS